MGRRLQDKQVDPHVALLGKGFCLLRGGGPVSSPDELQQVLGQAQLLLPAGCARPSKGSAQGGF